jgi:hypothetical protein
MMAMSKMAMDDNGDELDVATPTMSQLVAQVAALALAISQVPGEEGAGGRAAEEGGEP